MTGTKVAIANAGSALLAKVMGDGGVNPFESETKKLDNNFFGFFLSVDGRSGDVTYKDDKSEHEIDTPAQFYINVETMMYGYQCWVAKKKVDEHSDLLLNKENLPSEAEFKDHGPYGEDDGWSEYLGLHMIYVNPDGPEDGSDDISFTYNTSSGGGKRGVRMFLKKYWKEIRQHIGEDGLLMIPLVEMEINSFKTTDGHKIYSPSFEILDWVDRSDFGDSFDIGNGEEDDENYDEDDNDTSASKDEDDAGNYDGGNDDDVTDIDGETGDPVDDKSAEKPKGRGRGGRGKAGGKTASTHSKPQDDKADKPKPAGRRGRRGSAK